MPQLKRREFIGLLSGAAVAWPLSAHAQQPPKLFRIGVLETTPATMNAANFDALRQGFQQLGYQEGKNLVIDYRSADGRTERFPELAAELVRLKVDAIVTRGTPAAMAAQQATGTLSQSLWQRLPSRFCWSRAWRVRAAISPASARSPAS